MKNSADPEGAIHQGQRASVNKTLLDLQNSSYLTQLRLIIATYSCWIEVLGEAAPTTSLKFLLWSCSGMNPVKCLWIFVPHIWWISRQFSLTHSTSHCNSTQLMLVFVVEGDWINLKVTPKSVFFVITNKKFILS